MSAETFSAAFEVPVLISGAEQLRPRGRAARTARPRPRAAAGRQHQGLAPREHEGELRASTIRVLVAFDPKGTAVLLIGGDKRGRWHEFYAQAIPLADDLLDEHLAELENEGAP